MSIVRLLMQETEVIMDMATFFLTLSVVRSVNRTTTSRCGCEINTLGLRITSHWKNGCTSVVDFNYRQNQTIDYSGIYFQYDEILIGSNFGV